MGAKAHRRAAAWSGFGGALAGLLVFLQSELHVLNLDEWPLVVTTAVLVMIGLALAAAGEVRAQREADAERADTLDTALACWPLRAARNLSPYDVGVRQTLRAEETPWPYLTREADAAVREALERSNIVVVFGPAAAGKSRTAFEALPKNAVVLVPENTEGLALVFKHWSSLGIADEVPVVLWLDTLERYAPGLDVDPLIAFLRRSAPAGWSRRLRLRRRREGMAAPAPVKLVATIREEGLQELLDGDAAESYPVRRLCSCGEGVFLSAELSDVEREAFAEQYGFPSEGATVRQAFGSAWQSGWRSLPSPDPVATPGGSPWLSGTLVVLMGLIVGCIVWLGFNWGELTVPPPIKDQVAEIVDEADCPVEAFPADGKDLDEDSTRNADVLVAIEHGGDCGVSDTVRFYRNRNGRLREVSTLAAAESMARQTFSCLGPRASPCHVRLSGNEHLIVGAFEDAQTHQDFPVAVSFEDGGLRVWPLTPPRRQRLRGVPSSIQRLNQRLKTVRLRVGGSEPGAEVECRESFNCSRGRTAQDTAVLPANDGRPALLLAGYTSVGTVDAPEEVLVRIWNVALQRGAPQLDRDCVVLRNGLAQRIVNESDEGGLHKDRELRNGEVMC